MFIGKVIGNVWATRKHAALDGSKLLLVSPAEPFTEDLLGPAALAVDTVSAGIGDIVLVLDEGGSARKMLGRESAPVRTVICGIVDQVNSGGRIKKYG
ncbi:MAG: EutN/CcmL family microcompartment protein [bacterium]